MGTGKIYNLLCQPRVFTVNSRDKKKAVRKPLFLMVLTLNYLTMAFSSPLVYLMAIVSSDNAFIFDA